MVAALGAGAYVAAAFHLVTHAFFKALLFLGSGSVIHGMEHGVFHSGQHVDPQDMFNMGGLRRRMPLTFWTFLAGGLALSGFPLVTAGFWSKDEIFASTFNGHAAVFAALAVAAFLTAFYTMRQITLTFLGEPRTAAAAHAQETVWTMTFPLIVLSVFALGFGWVGIPEHFPVLGGLLPNWFHEFVGSTLAEAPEAAAFSPVPLLTSLVVALGGLLVGWLVYRRVTSPEQDALQVPVLKRKWYIDEVYDAVFVKPASWIAQTLVYEWMDRGLIDGFLNLFGKAVAGVGTGLRNFIDKPVINQFFGDGTASVVQGTGRGMRPMQTGRVQQYMLVSLIVLLMLAGLAYYFFTRV
jgi:NADH-quinone oxidoreductase subunit L